MPNLWEVFHRMVKNRTCKICDSPLIYVRTDPGNGYDIYFCKVCTQEFPFWQGEV